MRQRILLAIVFVFGLTLSLFALAQRLESDDLLSSRAVQIASVSDGGYRLVSEGGSEFRVDLGTRFLLNDQVLDRGQGRGLLAPGVSIRVLLSHRGEGGVVVLDRVQVVPK